MNKLKFTKGPWEINNLGDIVDSQGFMIAEMPGYKGHDDNAYLIAAAPEMLEALIEWLKASYIDYKNIEDFKNQFYRQIPVIEKATGMTIEEVLE